MTPLHAFELELVRRGFKSPFEVVADGRIRRAAAPGGRAATRDGWYALHQHEWGCAGVIGNWKDGSKETWTYPEERSSLARTCRPEVKHELPSPTTSNSRLAAIWRSGREPDPTHSYLQRKHVGSHGIRQTGRQLLVPLRTNDGALVGLQTISETGEKRLLSGSRKAGAYHLIGSVEDRIAIAEGYANAATINESSGMPAAMGIDAGNLLSSAQALRAKWPNARFLFVADEDESGVGEAKAREAAAAVNGRVVTPAQLRGKSDA